MAFLAAALHTAGATAQVAPPRPFSVDLYYTVSGSSTADAYVKKVTIASTTTVAAATITARQEIILLGVAGSTAGGVGDMVFGPSGEGLVVGAANRIYMVDCVNSAARAFPCVTGPMNGLPTATGIVTDPATDSAWVLSAENTLVQLPVSPSLWQGEPKPITGSDSIITGMAWISSGLGPRTLYAATDSGDPTKHHLGRIDLATGITTRLMSNFAAARTFSQDPFSGRLLAFGSTRIAQLNTDPSVPFLTSERDVAAIAPGIEIIDGTTDGQGRVFAIGRDGRLVIVDYAATQSIGQGNNPTVVLDLEPRPDPEAQGAGEIRGLAPLVGPGRPQLSYCLWDNGMFDNGNAQASQVSAPQGQPQTADDFYIEPNNIWRIDGIKATLISNTIFPKARLELYDDCNGEPGTLIKYWDTLDVRPTGETFEGLSVYSASFGLDSIRLFGGDQGATYWIVVQGLGLGGTLADEVWYWATAGEHVIKGSSGRFRSVTLGFPRWTPLDSFSCGCTDFAFGIMGEKCKTLYKNDGPDFELEPYGVLSQIHGSTTSARAADDFVVPPCGIEPPTVCFLQAYVYSNCDPLRGRFEIYDSTCAGQSAPVPNANPSFTAPFSTVIDMGLSVVINGEPMSTYCVQAWNLDWQLSPGRNYFVSAVGDNGTAFRNRTYFAYSADCQTACRTRFSPAMGIGMGLGLSQWTRLTTGPGGAGRDLAFQVGVNLPAPPPSSSTGSVPTCPGDFDGSGSVTIGDLLDFITEWINGCP